MAICDKSHTDMIINNGNYETDLKYDLELTRTLMRMIGAWPTDSGRSTILDRAITGLVRSLTMFFLLFFMVPIGCHLVFTEKDWTVKIEVLVTTNYCFDAVAKYVMVFVRKEEIRYCIDMIVADWREVDWAVCRSIMFENARSCRQFTAFFCAATYGCMSMIHFVVPFLIDPGSDQLRQNRTNLAPILYNAEFFVIDPRVSPMSEIVYVGQTLGAIVMCTVNSALSSLTVKFAMHARSRYEMVIALMQSVVDPGNGDDDDAKFHNDRRRKLGHIVRKHLHAIE